MHNISLAEEYNALKKEYESMVEAIDIPSIEDLKSISIEENRTKVYNLIHWKKICNMIFFLNNPTFCNLHI